VINKSGHQWSAIDVYFSWPRIKSKKNRLRSTKEIFNTIAKPRRRKEVMSQIGMRKMSIDEEFYFGEELCDEF
jgi:hypothetical protein